MGAGTWTKDAFVSYSTSLGRGVDSVTGRVTTSYSSADQVYSARHLDDKLNPYRVMRECRDTDEHPNTIPVILALDVTGSMGQTAIEVSKALNQIITNLYETTTDIEFMVMGIGDIEFDSSPIQASQFESDIRIAEQLDRLYFEWGGGWNSYESYSAAWYFALNNTDLDCWKRGRKGIVITMGDEELNPVLKNSDLNTSLGCSEQKDVDTAELFKSVFEKYDLYHIHVDHMDHRATEAINKSWEVLGDHYIKSTVNGIGDTIVNIISNAVINSENIALVNREISW